MNDTERDIYLDGHNKGYLEGDTAGVKKVVEWIREHGRMTYERAYGEITFDSRNWTTQVKEWGIE